MAQVQSIKEKVKAAIAPAKRNKVADNGETTVQRAPAGAAEGGSTPNAIIKLKNSALSTDIGPRAIAIMAGEKADEAEIVRLNQDIAAKRYEAQSIITEGIVKAALADDRVDLSLAFSSDTKQKEYLNNQIGLALGFREIVRGEPDKNGVAWDKFVNAKAVAQYLPMPGETEENTPNFRVKNTFRGNFITRVQQCAKAAAAIIENKMTAKYDKTAGTLMISGPAVKKHFGQDNVLLDQKQRVTAKDGKPVDLSEKPSFTALAAMGAVAHGKEGAVPRGSNTRGAGAPVGKGTGKGIVALSPSAALESMAKAFVTTIEKLDQALSKSTIAALESVMNACEVKLANSAKQ